MKMFFENENSEDCYSENYFQELAQKQGLSSIELIEAIPVKKLGDHVFCTWHDEVVDRYDCTKRECAYYIPNKSGRGACIHRGKLYDHGDKVTITVK